MANPTPISKSSARRRTSIGIMGSAGDLPAGVSESDLERAIARLADTVISMNCVLMTGETTGLPGRVARSVRAKGGTTVGIAPGENHLEQQERYAAESSEIVIYTGCGIKGRNVILVRSPDIVVIFGGSIGTLNEFTIAYDEGKIIGVIQGSGGVADFTSQLLTTLPKKSSARIFYHRDPAELLATCHEALLSSGLGAPADKRAPAV